MYICPLMNVTFYKYQGAGNDFVIIDNRAKTFPKENDILISRLCNRNFGIGADGLILLEDDADTDFRMIYFNSDGNESTMCGNGGRCIVAFANKLGIFEDETTFIAIDGLHNASMVNDVTYFSSSENFGRNTVKKLVSLQMIDVFSVKFENGDAFLNTGSPHHVQMVNDIKNVDVSTKGKEIRYGVYGTEGANVNFVEQKNPAALGFDVRTYERGVEDETLACGTGVTAAAIAMHACGKLENNYTSIYTKGGLLNVRFDYEDGIYKNVFLTGPADFVFSGTIEI